MADRLPGGPVAAIDCGTNAIRLLVAEVDEAGILHERVRELRTVRLGEGVDRTGEFSEAALQRTFAACDEYARIIDGLGAGPIRFVATSASRDVSNRAAFVAGVHARLGIEPEVIAGAEEAELSFLGAVRGLPQAPTSPALIVDIGGGSTEFVLGSLIGESWHLDRSISVDIGCVRMTERHLHGDPPTAAQVAQVQSDIAAALAQVRAKVPVEQARSLVGLAGTVTTMAAMALGLPRYDTELQHGATMTSAEVGQVAAALLAMTRAERAQLPFMHPGRVDVIGGGALILDAIMEQFDMDRVIVSECDLLDGIVYRLQAASFR